MEKSASSGSNVSLLGNSICHWTVTNCQIMTLLRKIGIWFHILPITVGVADSQHASCRQWPRLLTLSYQLHRPASLLH